MKKIIISSFLLCFTYLAIAQISIFPVHPVVDSLITITFDATKGNKALSNFVGDVYCHTGILTYKSVNNEWQRIQGKWGEADERVKMTKIGEGLYEISFNIRAFYGIPAGEQVFKLGFVFRNANGSIVARNVDNRDFYVEVFPTPYQNGLNYLPNGNLLFQLFAPNKQEVHLVGSFNSWQTLSNFQMQRQADGATYTLEVSGLDLGSNHTYQFLIDRALKIADPYSELVLDESNDSFIPTVTFPNLLRYPFGQTRGLVSWIRPKTNFNWQVNNFQIPKKTDLVIYELLLRDFIARHDYQTLTDTLDYLQRLGVNAIELMPINEFEGNISWGYNPSFHAALDKYYGTPEAFKRFVDEAHRRGMAVIVDVVFNHAFSQSPLAQLYWDQPNFRPAPNNPWLNVVPTHPFNVGYDFNHESQATKAFTKQTLRYWLEEYHIDGFRFDLSKGFTQVNSGNDVGRWSDYDASRAAIWKEYADYLWQVKEDALLILEHFGGLREERELANYGNGMLFWNNLNFQYNEATMGYNNDLSLTNYRSKGFDNPDAVTFMESHDEERLMYKNLQFGNARGSYNVKDLRTALQRVELASVFFYVVPGPKMLWQFGELGYEFSINYCPNGTISENCRVDVKPIRWEYFQNADRKRLYDITSKLIAFKTKYEVTETRDYRGDLFSSIRKTFQLNHPEFLTTVMGNFDLVPQAFFPGFQQTGWWYEYFTGDSLQVTNVNQSIALQPGEYRLYTSKNLNQSEVISSTFDLYADYQLQLFPNPTRKEINLIYTLKESASVDIAIFDLNGKLLKQLDLGQIPSGISQQRIDLDLSVGGYWLQLATERGQQFLKFVVQ